ncbi:MAG: alpha/beta hydrolase [Bacteroidetes bacterium]|jgi:fermentation-respiration switch protein FrsA (DUF1100 family)|nr:alpha/beta hydrolase [Bacteroidota bacterium]MBX7128846.1 alpha/beta hydrolase [Flavobacteriales bacterium]MCC6654260.1 alpha/beta hydrolase [Flavobacteriales bacterium]HMU14571.1 alpha/beta hydrolase [Flavobacteriales bacterium]HMZ48834.1 alpha/beta hydrolase [Flavobacteriales bacterium]
MDHPLIAVLTGYFHGVLFFTLYTLLAVALLYGVVCLIYWWVQERFIFVRFRLARTYRFAFPGPFEEVFLEPAPAVTLHALLFRASATKGTVLYFHGNAGSLKRWGKKAQRFTRQGWNVLMPDYRGYGKSRGRLSEAALHADAAVWYDWLTGHEKEDRIIVYGRSLGSGMAVPVAAANHPRALVLESPFANLYDAARHQFYLLPYRSLLRYAFRNDKAIRRVTCPVHIFHGKRDPIVPYESALRLYAAVPDTVHREMLTFERGFHSDLWGFKRFQRVMGRILGTGQ